MSAYLVVDLDIHDPKPLPITARRLCPWWQRPADVLIALDDAPLELEGWQATNMLIIEFPDMDAIRGLFARRICTARTSTAGCRGFADHCLARRLEH